VNVGISVSRVGGSAQTKAMKNVAGRLRLDLAQFRELEAFAAFASDLDAATKRQLERGARTVEILKQGQYSPLPFEEQVAVIYAVTNGFLDTIDTGKVRAWEKGFLEYVRAQFPQILDGMRTTKALAKDAEAELKRAIETSVMVRSDVSDEVRGLIGADQSIADVESAHAMLLAQGIPLGTSYWRGSSLPAARVLASFQAERSARARARPSCWLGMG
jgi:hypothetical protein